jgi:mannose-6-phosphate isomerase
MRLAPAYKNYLWGGDRLTREYGKTAAARPVAESWELSCHPDGLCVVSSGAYEGRTLSNVLDERPDWMWPGAAGSSQFPILIKFIDAKRDLSLQVHPGDEYARKYEDDRGKNEAWYIVDCEANSKLALGLTKHMQKSELAQIMPTGAILDYVNWTRAKPGDCFSVPAGLLHAISGGMIIAEVQQSSNVTYRVYDYDRLDAGGNPRKLHIEQAADVIDTSARSINAADRGENTVGASCCANQTDERCGECVKEKLTDWEFFELMRVKINGSAPLCCGDTFQALLLIEGSLEIIYRNHDIDADDRNQSVKCNGTFHNATMVKMNKGSCVYVPSGLGPYELRGKGLALLASVLNR